MIVGPCPVEVVIMLLADRRMVCVILYLWSVICDLRPGSGSASQV